MPEFSVCFCQAPKCLGLSESIAYLTKDRERLFADVDCVLVVASFSADDRQVVQRLPLATAVINLLRDFQGVVVVRTRLLKFTKIFISDAQVIKRIRFATAKPELTINR